MRAVKAAGQTIAKPDSSVGNLARSIHINFIGFVWSSTSRRQASVCLTFLGRMGTIRPTNEWRRSARTRRPRLSLADQPVHQFIGRARITDNPDERNRVFGRSNDKERARPASLP